MTDVYRSELSAAIEAFLCDASTAARDRSALIDYLKARPTRDSSVPFYIDNVEWRIETAREAHRVLEDRGPEYLGPLAWSILMVTPTENIQERGAVNLITEVTLMVELLLKICSLLRYAAIILVL